jgi:NADPH:quinone reductase-like Zn-dependent oxidoreductase
MAWGAIDAVGGALTGTLTDCVRVSGTIFVYGALSGISFTGSVINAIFRDVTIKGFWLSTWLHNLSGV